MLATDPKHFMVWVKSIVTEYFVYPNPQSAVVLWEYPATRFRLNLSYKGPPTYVGGFDPETVFKMQVVASITQSFGHSWVKRSEIRMS